MILKPRLFRKVNFTHPIARGLVAYWPMLEGVGNKINDLSGNRNHGTLVGDTHWAAGRSGPCLSFDGTGDYVDLGTGPSFSGQVIFTILAWVKTTDTAAVKSVLMQRDSVGYNGAYWFQIDNSASYKLYGLIRNTAGSQATATYNTSISDGKFHQVGLRYDGATLLLFVDGIAVGSTGSLVDCDFNGNIKTTIGYDARDSNDYFNGLIDNVMIFNRALSASEILQLYKEPFCLFKKKMNPTLIQFLIDLGRRWWGWW